MLMGPGGCFVVCPETKTLATKTTPKIKRREPIASRVSVTPRSPAMSKPPVNVKNPSPRQLAHELNVARSPDPKVRIETTIIGCGGDFRGEIGRRLRKVRVIECVKEAGSKLEREPLSHLEGSLQGHIPRIQARSYQGIARAIAECSWGRVGE